MSVLAQVSSILSSQARFRVLRELCVLNGPASLRGIESVTGLAVRSVQVALSGSIAEGTVLQKGKGRDKRYLFSWKHPSAETLKDIFERVTLKELEQRAVAYSARAYAVIALCDEVNPVIRRARAQLRSPE